MLIPTPMAQEQALRALADIRAAMDRSTRYSTFSALSGFVASAAALIGSGGCGWFAGFPGAQPATGWAFLGVWGAVLAMAFGAFWFLTAMKARRRGENLWTPIARTAATALSGPWLAAVVGTAVFAATGKFEMLPGLWLLLYGCGLWSLSFFAPTFFRGLGVACMAWGFAAWLLPEYTGFWLGTGFGGVHAIFGAVVVARYRG